MTCGTTDFISMPLPPIKLLTPDWPDYELLDTGNGLKLERFAGKIIVRDEPKAWWKPSLPEKAWNAACNKLDPKTGVTVGSTELSWIMSLHGLKFRLKLTPGSRHVGAFPEMVPQWEWLQSQLKSLPQSKPKMLNLFGYTGIASVFGAASGAEVTHVDASRPSLDWARENTELNTAALSGGSVRWMLDDALDFVKREIRREKEYDIIILDPPSYGRGPKGQIWKTEEQLYELLTSCKALLGKQNALFILTLYNLSISAYTLRNLLQQIFAVNDDAMEIGELALMPKPSSSNPQPSVLSLAQFARFQR